MHLGIFPFKDKVAVALSLTLTLFCHCFTVYVDNVENSLKVKNKTRIHKISVHED